MKFANATKPDWKSGVSEVEGPAVSTLAAKKLSD
jgi:hypothetical protein